MSPLRRYANELACAAGVLAAALSLQVLSWAWLLSRPDWTAPWQDALGANAVLGLFSLLFGLPLGWALGMPLLRASHRWGRWRLGRICISGALLGLLGGVGLWLGLLRFSDAGPAVMAALAVAGSVGGAAAAGVQAWLQGRA